MKLHNSTSQTRPSRPVNPAAININALATRPNILTKRGVRWARRDR